MTSEERRMVAGPAAGADGATDVGTVLTADLEQRVHDLVVGEPRHGL
jgi:hypothetical protein